MNGEKWIEKYRPKTFTEVLGQTDNLTAIEGFILSGSIPHMLFYGDVGTGKTTAAEIVAHKILGEYFDGNFIELNASNDRGIDAMRKVIIKATKHKPFFAPFKVVLMEEADGLTQDAQDVLKRPIEKAKYTVFIFTCNDIDKIIKPIKSRCALFEFKPLSDSDVIEGLKRIVAKEKISIGDDYLQRIAKQVNGDMRSAVNELQKLSGLNNRNSEIDRIVKQYMDKEKQIAVSQS